MMENNKLVLIAIGAGSAVATLYYMYRRSCDQAESSPKTKPLDLDEGLLIAPAALEDLERRVLPMLRVALQDESTHGPSKKKTELQRAHEEQMKMTPSDTLIDFESWAHVDHPVFGVWIGSGVGDDGFT